MLFTLLLHARFFACYKPDHESSVKQIAYLVKGANRLFWLDLESGSKTFFHIWNFLHRVVTRPEYWRGVVKKKYMDLFDLVAKFYFYYMPDHDQFLAFTRATQALFDECRPALDLPPNYANLDTLNLFCAGTIRTLRLIKNERAILSYLSCCLYFGDQERPTSSPPPATRPSAPLNRKTRVLLANTLDDLATPGYPLYPTPSIKKKSRQVINQLWPRGRFWRSTINFLFRLLRPPSFFHWYQKTHVSGLVRSICALPLRLLASARSALLSLRVRARESHDAALSLSPRFSANNQNTFYRIFFPLLCRRLSTDIPTAKNAAPPRPGDGRSSFSS
ncbi:uncharacterized protein LOC126326037 [Schistocerca gregaria]|uniref:uncharacterized protein LOC126326037 n=1 Tax=Schistocerca gregaria TaxID=7010 RepID=UPI00211DC731|nr:uncharacterized protein LOC126326037 [Schistocerca gregaria]